MLKKTLKALLAVFAVCGAALGIMHALNCWVFARASGKSRAKNVWKSGYGEIAFTKEGEGTPVLLVHGIGIGAGSVDWEKNVSALAQKYCVYTLDLPGFGSSEKRKMTYNSYYYARVINDFIFKVIGQRAVVIAQDMSCGFVLAGVRFDPKLYGKIIIVNPYTVGMGYKYKENAFVKAVLPLPVIGTLVYNFISSRQSILSFLDNAAPLTESYGEVAPHMEKKYANAHRFGTNNKYAAISMINGYNDVNAFSLIKGCPVPLSVVVSGKSTLFVPLYDNITVIEIESGEHYPNIYAAREFNDFVERFIRSKIAGIGV